jgi:hypothetical protein
VAEAEPSAAGQDVLRATNLLTTCNGHTSDMPWEEKAEGWVEFAYNSGSSTSSAKSMVSLHLLMEANVWPAVPVAEEVNGALDIKFIM